MLKDTFFQSRQQKRRIVHRAKKSKNRIEFVRCRIILLLAEKIPVATISNLLECARATVYRTLYRFEEMGEEGLIDRRFFQEPKKVDDSILKRLYELVDMNPRDLGWQRSTWSLELFSLQIHEEFGVKFSLSHIRNLLLNFQCRLGMPKPALRKPIRGRRLILEKIARVVKRSSPRDEVFYADEVDIHLNPKMGRAYMKKGTQHLVITPGQNKKHYLSGAVNYRTGAIIYSEGSYKNSMLFIAMLERISAAYRKSARIHLILDNYIIHKSRVILQWLSKYGQGFVFHFLPPYSPDENKIERLWRQLHSNVTRNHRHETIEELMTAVREFLKNAAPFPGKKVSISKMAA